MQPEIFLAPAGNLGYNLEAVEKQNKTQGDCNAVEKVKPDSLNLSVKTVVGSVFMKDRRERWLWWAFPFPVGKYRIYMLTCHKKGKG